MGHREFIDQALQPLRFFQRVKVFALDVFNQRHRQRGFIRNFTDQRRHFFQSGHLGSTPATFTRDDFVTLFAIIQRTHQNRLHQPAGTNRSRQFFQRALVHPRARLVFPGLQTGHRQRTLRFIAVAFAAGGQQGVKPTAQAFLSHAFAPLPRRSRISSASAM